ncbi:MAG: hypothetical protein M3331_04930 [Actinomycetota bacterium]|nr:hypothetical protein [Actinomycetota bacterium]
MAARRLIAILLVLLFLSSLATALAPVEQAGNADSTTSTDTSTTDSTTLSGPSTGDPQLIRQSIDSSLAEPPVVRATVGDQLQLQVTSQQPGTVELVGIGPTEDVGARQPAHFDVLLRAEGTFPVRLLGTKREIALIKVTAPGADASAG